MEPTTFWYHVTSHTYGSWLYGDPRGFRTRHHREHVEGDYKNPPPKGKYDDKFQRSKDSLKRSKVILTPDWRRVVGVAVLDKLLRLSAEVLTISVSATHLHAQVKLHPADPRDWMGLAKKHAWHEARARGWQTQLWAKRGKAERVRDKAHQRNTFNYIVKHAEKEGAWVWTYLEPVPALADLPASLPVT